MGYNAAKKAKNFLWDRHVEETNAVFDLLVKED
jgi:hypothetical protein